MMTNAHFARQAAYLAKNAADWAGDALLQPEVALDAPSTDRFLADMRARLVRIEEMIRPVDR